MSSRNHHSRLAAAAARDHADAIRHQRMFQRVCEEVGAQYVDIFERALESVGLDESQREHARAALVRELQAMKVTSDEP